MSKDGLSCTPKWESRLILFVYFTCKRISFIRFEQFLVDHWRFEDFFLSRSGLGTHLLITLSSDGLNFNSAEAHGLVKIKLNDEKEKTIFGFVHYSYERSKRNYFSVGLILN